MTTSSFPPLYAGWLESFLGAAIPEEKASTCLACPMLEGRDAELQFHPDTKCCTFFPELPSFAIGGLFLDEDPALERGRELVRARLELGQQVTPLGIGRPGAYYKIYGRRDTFGTAPSLRCPFFINEGPGLCGVWRFREATCATWYCKHERGRVGLDFWAAIRRVLRVMEERLGYVVAIELGIDEGALAAVRATTATLHRQLDPEYYAGIWDPWAGRELDYYRACARVVSGLDWEAARARCGADLEPYLAAARQAWDELRGGSQLPDLVRIRPFRRVGKLGDTTTLQTYSPFDALTLADRAVAGLVQHEVATVTELVSELGGIGVDRPLLQRMMDMDLVEQADG